MPETQTPETLLAACTVEQGDRYGGPALLMRATGDVLVDALSHPHTGIRATVRLVVAP